MNQILPDLIPLATPLDRLESLEGNPRRGDVEAVAASLKQFGQHKAIVARKTGVDKDGNPTGVVLAGNHTFAGVKLLEWDSIAVVWTDDDELTAKARALADNHTSTLGTYDEEALAAMLADVAVNPALMAAASFSEDDLERLLKTGPTSGNTDAEAIPEVPENPFSNVGDVWILGEHRLMNGDSTNKEHVAKLMNGEKAVLMSTDPPYLVDYDGSNHPQGEVNSAMTKNKQWDAYVDPKNGAQFFTDFIAVALKVALVDRVPIYQWHADMRRDLVLQGWEANGLIPHQTIIWVKARPVLTRSDLMWQHEPCLYGWVRGTRPENDRRPPANVTTVWSVDKQGSSNDLHPTEKPIELFVRPIQWHMRIGEICYEPFGGSGSQIIAAQTTRRRCYTMELASEYVDVICRRYQEFTGEKPVLESTGEPHDFTTA